jgi:ribosomal protein L40E
MGFRFYRRKRIAPGITLNFGKKGVSLSAGPRGAKVTVGRRGVRTTIGLPGSGLYYTKQFRSPRATPRTTTVPKSAPQPGKLFGRLGLTPNATNPALTAPARALLSPISYCSNCGARLPAQARFCVECGTKVTVPGA